MKTTTRNALVVVSAAALVGLTATAQAWTGPPAQPTTATSFAAADLESGLAQDLRFSREEERLARDLYAALAAVHDGARPMSRITNSEQQHFEQVGTLLEKHGLEDPSEGLPAGEYAFEDLQGLYDGWFAEGKASVNAAYQVGIELETRDIADLTRIIADSSEADVDAVLSRLLAASEHHLAAFTRASEGTLPTEPGQGMQNGPGMQTRGPGQGQRRGPGQGGQMGPGQTQTQHECSLTDDTTS